MANNIENNENYYDLEFQQLELLDQKFEKITFENCKFIRCDFSNCEFLQCKFIEYEFSHCNLSSIKINGSLFSEVAFTESKILGVNWSLAKWPHIKITSQIQFYQCNLSHSSFYGLSLIELTIDSCKVHEADFREADLSRANLVYSDFYKSLFIHTNLSYADFTESFNYSIDTNLNKIEKAKFSFPQVIGLLTSLNIEIKGLEQVE